MDRQSALRSIGHINTSTADASELKEAVETYMQAALMQIDAEGRQPDAWEGSDLIAAVGAASCGLYKLALTHVNEAFTPPEKRAPETLGNSLVEPPTLSALEHGLSELRGQPAITRI